MADYYKIDSRKVTLREYWNILPSWKVLIPWLAGRFNVSLSLGSGFGVPTVREMEVGETGFPPLALTRLQPGLEESRRLGFHSPRFFTFENLRRDTRTSFITLLHHSGDFNLRLMHTLASNINPPFEQHVAVLMSELSDGTRFFTSNQKAKFRSLPGTVAQRLLGAPLSQLLEAHQQRLHELSQTNPPKKIHTTETSDDTWDRYEEAAMSFYVRQGLYVAMTPEEVANEQGVQKEVETMTTEGVAHAEVLAELNQLQNKKGGWGNAIVIFVLSMLLFVGAGAQQWSWKYVLMLVPILFFHELGHYVAMRAFHYRNLRMFFLPFFGAAVAGRHYNVPGWKKVIVSMMGPVPGIVLGTILGGIGLIAHEPELTRFALVMLILNGLNLLPVLPLDGGWIFHTLLFSRHPLLDAAFRLLAVAALLLGGMYSGDKLLMYLSIPMLFGIPLAYRMARLTADLRRRGVPPGSPDDQTVPPETAVLIIDELKKTTPKGAHNKILAQQTLQIFENLNAKPPGWLATSGLFFVYLTSLGMALVFAAILVGGPQSALARFSSGKRGSLKHELACGSSLFWRGTNAAVAAQAPTLTIVATFARHSRALNSFQSLTNQLPASAMLTTLGNSVLLTLPAADNELRKDWFEKLQQQTQELFVDVTNRPASLSLSAQLPNETQAEAVEQELNEYLSNDYSRTLIPPWHPEEHRSPEQRAAHTLARATYLRDKTARWSASANSKMRDLQRKIAEAKRQGDDAEVRALLQKISALGTELERERLEKLKDDSTTPVDAALIDLLKKLPGSHRGEGVPPVANPNEFQAVREEITRRMGQLPLVNGRVLLNENRFSTSGGYVSRDGRTVHLQWITFRRLGDGAPALVDWLCDKGSSRLKFEWPDSSNTLLEEEEQ